MRFAPLKVVNGYVFVILWTVKVINQNEKINGSIGFLSKNHWFWSQKCLQRVRMGHRKINSISLFFLVGENYCSIWFLVWNPASNHDCLKNRRSKILIFWIFIIFSMIFTKISLNITKNHILSVFASIFGWFSRIFHENHRKIMKNQKIQNFASTVL